MGEDEKDGTVGVALTEGLSAHTSRKVTHSLLHLKSHNVITMMS